MTGILPLTRQEETPVKEGISEGDRTSGLKIFIVKTLLNLVCIKFNAYIKTAT